MKLLTIFAIAAIAFNIAQAQAESCEGGTLQTAENGHVYCRSTIYMNWWSAYTWCEAQGRHLASMYEICPTWDGTIGEGKICNLSSFPRDVYNWTSTALESNYTFAVDKTWVLGNNSYNGWRNKTLNRALCY